MSSFNTSKHVMLIGVGPHAQKVYVPWLAQFGKDYGAELKLCIELKSKTIVTTNFLKKFPLSCESVFIDPLPGRKINSNMRSKLDHLVHTHHIEIVIIATEPSVHKAYALWALQNNLNILMDKPITTIPGIANDEKLSHSLLEEYKEICESYERKRVDKKIVFSVNVQRRFHPSFELVFLKLKEVVEKTNCPITSIQSSHGDGQWRLPDELVDIDYHGFKNGYGKMSHSGYHFFDIIAQFLKIGIPLEKRPNTVEVFAKTNKCSDYLQQFGSKDVARVFGSNFKQKYSDQELMKSCRNYGEIDTFSLMSFKKDGANISSAQLSLMHNSFSQRSWAKARGDLYKGNGRVKHEYHCIQQGPFQSIQIHSYQANDLHEENIEDDYKIGGNNHFDIHIFRNADMIGGKKFEKVSINELLEKNCSIELLTTLTKNKVLVEFFEHVNGTRQGILKSNITDQWLGVMLMSLHYQSAAREMIVAGKI